MKTKEARVLDYLLGEDDGHENQENWEYIPRLVEEYLRQRKWDMGQTFEKNKWYVVYANSHQGRYNETTIRFKTSSTKSYIRSYTKLFHGWLQTIEGIEI